MGKWDVRIFTATYSSEGDEVVVELYGKTRDGEGIVVRHKDFRPYFYMLDPPQQSRDSLKRDPEVAELKDVELFIGTAKRRFLKVTIRHPFKVPQYRDRYRYGTEFFAADIPFGQRFMYDMDLGACTTVMGEEAPDAERKKYSTKLVVNAHGYEECAPFQPSLKILSFDIENSIKKDTFGQLFCIGWQVREPGSAELRSGIFTGGEPAILRSFEEFVQKEDPDIITGYNIDNYDIPTILKRCVANGLPEPRWGRDGSAPRSVSERFWRVTGRMIADAWWNAKLALKPKKETLNAIAKQVLNEEKLDVDPLQIDREWAQNREKVLEYCKKDAELALRILEKINILKRGMDLASVSKLALDDVVNGRTSTLIDSILIRKADRAGIAVPMTRRDRKDDKIEGGYVHIMNPGLYHWVCVLDFKAMYPSVIIANNICFTTLDAKGETVSPIGVRFLKKETKEGLLPGILSTLMNDRQDAQRKRNEARMAQNKAEAEYYDGLQDAVKILMNSVYGVFASAFYRFTNQSIGASITAFARENIKGVIKKLEAEKLPVLYSDTDSVFFTLPEEQRNKDAAVKFGKSKAEEFSKGGATLEFQGIYEPMFSHGAKKRYVARCIWPKDEMVVRGYETRRTDAFDLLSESLNIIFEHVLADRIEDAKTYAKQIVSDAKCGKVPVDKLVISRTVQGTGDGEGASVYKNPDSMANVSAARKLRTLGYEFVPGMKVSWIVTDAAKSPQQVEPFIDGRPFEFTPDWRYYAKRLAISLSRVTEPFGLDEETLLTGIKQRGLDSFNCDEGPKKPGKGALRKDKEPASRSLDEFM